VLPDLLDLVEPRGPQAHKVLPVPTVVLVQQVRKASDPQAPWALPDPQDSGLMESTESLVPSEPLERQALKALRATLL
jgi:hypothetical protein